MRSGLIMQWLRSAAGRGFAGALMLALPVAVAGTIGFSEGIGGIGAALGTFPGDEPQASPESGSEPPGSEAIVLPVSTSVPAAPVGGADGGGGAPTTTTPGGGDTGGGTPPAGGGGGTVEVPTGSPPAGGGGLAPEVPSVDVGTAVEQTRPIQELVEAVQSALGAG